MSPASGQKSVRDAIIRGFALRVTTSRAKSFVVEKRIDGKVKRITLGRFGELTVEQARKEALKFTGKIAIGLNPLAECERARLAQVSSPTPRTGNPSARVRKTSDVEFTIHDLRRTVITVAESIDIQPDAIKRMVNHKMRDDVTAAYIVADVERLRKPVKRVSDFLSKAIGLRDSTSVLPLRTAQAET